LPNADNQPRGGDYSTLFKQKVGLISLEFNIIAQK